MICSAVSDATIAALDQLEHYDGTRPHTVVQLMPNCPMRGRERNNQRA